MVGIGELLARAASAAADYRAGLADRRVAPELDLEGLRETLGSDLPTTGVAAEEVVEQLLDAAQPGLVASAGPRYFGFVVGGALPAATAADVVAVGWDQNAFNLALSPASLVVEEVAGGWLKELLGIPATASVGFVTGGQQANTVGLAAARHAMLTDAGWDVERGGLRGGPRLRIVAGDERHATIDRSLRLLGIGTDVIEAVDADGNGATDPADLERVLGAGPTAPTIVCLQAGNVNTGACDDLRRGTEIAHEHGAWVHVDGAFGLWAAASPSTRHLVDGVELADSWACDGHKWLNVPYDSGYAFCARPEMHARALRYSAPYLVDLPSGTATAGAGFTLEGSRRARGFATWAALRELGRDGTAELVERCCRLARRFAESLSTGGATIANDVVLNQVLVDFGDDEATERVIAGVQRDGTCWMGGTTWRGRRVMRISVSNWSTTEDDVDRSVEAILRIASDEP